MTTTPPSEEHVTPVDRIEVVRGGSIDAAEAAALAVALAPGHAPSEEPASGGRAAGPSAWGEASLLEGVGFRPFVSVDDVERYHRSLA